MDYNQAEEMYARRGIVTVHFDNHVNTQVLIYLQHLSNYKYSGKLAKYTKHSRQLSTFSIGQHESHLTKSQANKTIDI